MQTTKIITLDKKTYFVRTFAAFIRVDGTAQEEQMEIVRQFRVRVGVNSARPSYSYRNVSVSPFSALGKRLIAQAVAA